MAGVRNIRKVDMAVVPYRGYSYAVRGRSVAKNVARQQKAFGFWRIKREKRAK
jgi:hypothetical protein